MSPKFSALILSTVVVHFSFCVRTDLPVQPVRPSCSSTLTTLRELRAAAIKFYNQSVTSRQNDSEPVVCVNLQPHTVEYVGYSFLVIESVSLVITGQSTGNDSKAVPVVMCEPQFNGNLTEGDYPFSVTNSSLVAIEGVHFEGCLRPLQFNNITRIVILACEFRYSVMT